MSTLSDRDQIPTDRAVLFLTAGEAAALLRLSTVTLSRWRTEGGGPRYRKFGRRVLYAHADLIAWAEQQTRRNTSEPSSK